MAILTATPGSAASVSITPYDDEPWANPTNIVGETSTEASITTTTFDANDQSYVLKAYNFDFSSIPAGSTINGIDVEIWADETTATATIYAQLLNTAGNLAGTSYNWVMDDFFVDYIFGSSTNTWGNTLTEAWVKDPDFGVGIWVQAGDNNCNVWIRYVYLSVHYTPPATTVYPSIYVGGSKKTVTGAWVCVNGTNKPVEGIWICVNGTYKPLV